MDDQFAYIPNAFAATYFDGPPDPTDPDTKIAAAARAAASGDEGYVMVATHAKSCMWPEGALTCRVMRGGAKLELLAARMRIVKWCSGRDKMRCRPSWGNGGKCRGSPWGPKTDNGPKPPTVAATNWVMLKDGKLPRRDAPTTAAMGTGCMTVVGEGGQSKESVVVACGSWCHSLPVRSPHCPALLATGSALGLTSGVLAFAHAGLRVLLDLHARPDARALLHEAFLR